MTKIADKKDLFNVPDVWCTFCGTKMNDANSHVLENGSKYIELEYPDCGSPWFNKGSQEGWHRGKNYTRSYDPEID